MVVKKKLVEKIPEEEIIPFENPRNEKNKNSSVKNFLILLFAIFTLLGSAGTYYFFSKYNALRNDPSIVSQKDVDTTVAAVYKLMVLPSDEMPTLATILDKTKLAGQSFFDNAENGDKLLAFTKSMQAILYRPSTNKIIKVAPIYISDGTTDQLTSTTTQEELQPIPEEQNMSEDLKVAYYNGTTIANLSSQTEANVKTNYPNYQTTDLTNATNHNYTENIVVDISGQHTQEATDLADLLGAKVMSLPNGEVKPNADILIISGK